MGDYMRIYYHITFIITLIFNLYEVQLKPAISKNHKDQLL